MGVAALVTAKVPARRLRGRLIMIAKALARRVQDEDGADDGAG